MRRRGSQLLVSQLWDTPNYRGRIRDISPLPGTLVGGSYNGFVHEEPGVTLAALARDATLPITLVTLAGRSAETVVSWVHTTERVDPRPHLRPHELVCTLGSSLVQSGSARTFARALVASEVAGVVLGLGEVHLSPPSSLVSACEEFGLPLLAIPHDVPFRAVDEAVLRRHDQLESAARRREGACLATLTSLARAGASSERLLHEAAATLDSEITLESDSDADSGGSPMWAGIGFEPSSEFLGQLGSLLDLAMLERDRGEAEQHARIGQLVDLIGRGLAHPAALAPELAALGLDETKLQVSVWPEGSAQELQRLWPSALVGVAQRSVVLIAAPVQPEALSAAGFVCGYSSVIGIAGVRRGVNEARSAFTLARSRGSVAGPLDLVSLDAILEQLPAETLTPFVETLISPLLDSEGGTDGELVRTLATYIDNDRQMQATADQLFVHVNTVRHRLNRIRILTDRDPQTVSGLTDLRIGLWALERRQVIAHRLTRPLR